MKDLSFWDWIWIGLTLLLGGNVAVFSFVPPIQEWVIKTTGFSWLMSPTFMTLFWLMWFVLGHDTVTTALALAEHWTWHAATTGVGLIVVGIATLLPVIGVALKYLWDNGGPTGWYLLAGMAVLAVCGTYYWFRNK